MDVQHDLAKLPWPNPRPSIAANYVVGGLRETCLNVLKNDKGVHAETLMVLIGALGGFAAAQAAVRAGLPVHEVKTRDNRIFLIGDSINEFLFGSDKQPLSIRAFVFAAALQQGCPADKLPDIHEIAGHVARTIGGPDFGIVRAPDAHKPALTPFEAIQRFWPLAHDVLSFEKHVGAASNALEAEHWPAVCGIVAQQFIGMGKGVLDPSLAVRLTMESAIITAKLDPRYPP